MRGQIYLDINPLLLASRLLRLFLNLGSCITGGGLTTVWLPLLRRFGG